MRPLRAKVGTSREGGCALPTATPPPLSPPRAELEGTLGLPPLRLLTVPPSVRPEGSLQPVPSSATCFTSRLAPVGKCGGARARGWVRAHAHRGVEGTAPARSTSARRRARGSRVPSPPLDHSSDRLLPAGLAGSPPLKSQRGALGSPRPSGAGRGGGPGRRDAARDGPQAARSLAEARQGLLPPAARARSPGAEG